MQLRILGALCVLTLSCSALAQQVTLKIAHFLPPATPVQKKVLEPWCESLNKASEDRIRCQFYPAMQLGGTPAQLVDQVRSGVADVVWTAPGYSSGRFPTIEAFEMPFMIRDAVSGSKALWQYYEQAAQQEFSAYQVLAFHVDGGQALHTAKKELKTAADLRGVKLRTSTRLGARTLSALGGEPVAMPPAQLTEAIAKGVIDGAMASWEVVAPTKLDEVTEYHLQPASGQSYPSATILTVLMNKRKFAALPADLQEIITRHSGPALVASLGEVFEEEIAGAQARIVAKGGQIHELSAEELDAMHKASASVEQEWIRMANDKGLDGPRLAALAREIASSTER